VTQDRLRRSLRVAIDGPAGAGKSTAARGLAARLGYVLLDTGALYRTVALAAVQAEIAWDDEPAVAALAEKLVADDAIAIEAAADAPTSLPPGVLRDPVGGSGMRVGLYGRDVSLAIRRPEMSLGASRVSAIPAVRAALLAIQRRAGASGGVIGARSGGVGAVGGVAGALGGVVMEGRDIGTVVLPDAEVKFFLTAPASVRARRRVDELAARGQRVDFDDTLREVIARDRADTERPVAPLRMADDAILVDSSHRSAAEIIEEMARVVLERARAS
jgi:cytidylate kinase